MKKYIYKLGLFLTLPSIIFLFIFVIYPLLYNVYLSLHEFDFVKATFVFKGFDNYVSLLNDPVFQRAFLNTIVFTLTSTSLELIIGLFLAIIVSLFLPFGKRLARTLITTPYFLAAVTAAYTWKYLLAPIYGLINNLLGIQIPWLSDPVLALISIIIADAWKTAPFFFLIFFAAIESIPPTYIEAIRVDGASTWQELRYVVIPLLKPYMLVGLVIRSIDAFTKCFDIVYILTGGGPGSATEVLPTLSFHYMFEYLKWGKASATALISVISTFALIIIYMRMLRRR